MIARPARVRIRSRKPWVLDRRRLFGWNVRLLTRDSHYDDGADPPVGGGRRVGALAAAPPTRKLTLRTDRAARPGNRPAIALRGRQGPSTDPTSIAEFDARPVGGTERPGGGRPPMVGALCTAGTEARRRRPALSVADAPDGGCRSLPGCG